VIVNSIGPYPLEGFKKLENAVMALGQKMVPEGEA
jgi:hypothetical protein